VSEEAGSGTAPAGVRSLDPVTDSLGEKVGVRRLRWVWPGPFELGMGDRVAVREHDAEWLGEVVVPPGRLVEWPELSGLPVVTRRVADAEWPSPPVTAGRRLLDSLALPPELLVRQVSGSTTVPLIADASAGAGDPAEHDGEDQEYGGGQRQSE
jgi:hypothetical protein